MPLDIPRDVQEFIQNYPQNDDDASLSSNLQFYKNKLPCQPDNLFIDALHDK